MRSTNGRPVWTAISALACAACLTSCGGKPPSAPLVVTSVQATCITVPDGLLDCAKPVVPDPATAKDSDVGRLLLRQDTALDMCAAQMATLREILADRRCKAPAVPAAGSAP